MRRLGDRLRVLGRDAVTHPDHAPTGPLSCEAIETYKAGDDGRSLRRHFELESLGPLIPCASCLFIAPAAGFRMRILSEPRQITMSIHIDRLAS
jgi:hypothetical protein